MGRFKNAYWSAVRKSSRGLKALYTVARQNPEEASSFVPDLVGLLDKDHTRIRGESAEILWEIAKEEPRKTAEAVEGLGELLKDDYLPAQRVSLGALAEIATERPHDVSHFVEDAVLRVIRSSVCRRRSSRRA